MKTIIWFRKDLRLTDNPALLEAAENGEIIPVYIWAPEEEGNWAPGHMSEAWLKHSLKALNQSLQEKLIIRKGSSLKNLLEIVKKTGAESVYFNRCYEPDVINRDLTVKEALTQKKINVKTFNSNLLIEPWEIGTREKKPYQMFTPFYKACLKWEPFFPEGKPKLKISSQLPSSLEVDDLSLPDEPLEMWEIGERGAMKRVQKFVKDGLETYEKGRDRPDLDGVSRLSPHLHFGEISPRQVYSLTHSNATFVKELMWREFAHHLLFHFTDTPDWPLQKKFNHFTWNEDPKNLKAWKEGKTGYPIVDAGMRQLLEMGWMHNRVRMIVASFLTKDLLIPWQEGAHWFWEKLVDADLANNTLGWQWTAGCGADAAPYFRIFNPTSQGEKFDPEGHYIRQYVPELCDVPKEFIHHPWDSPNPPKKYPQPIVEHAFARKRALEAFEEVKNENRDRRK